MELFVDVKKKLPGFIMDVKFDAGNDVLGLLGASGSGKSMTLKFIAGIENPDSGRIVLNERVLYDSEKGINIPARLRKVGYLFQNYALFPNMTVEQNIGFALEGLPKEKRNFIISEKISMMKLDGLEKRYPFQLSGGQQQRAALARALAIEPEILLLDEPFSALDDHLRSLLTKQLIDTLSDYHGVTLFVTHNMEEAYKICKSLVVLKNGKAESAGEKDEIFQNPSKISTARLTGCKNFSKARCILEDMLYAEDWGITLNVEKTLDSNTEYIGIRANYIKPATEKDEVNVFDCWPSFVSEAPFRAMIYLSIGRKAKNGEDYHLQWDISKEKWLEMKELPLPWKIYLDPAKLMKLQN